MLADIVVGETAAADVLFLLAAIAAGIHFVLDFLSTRDVNLIALAICLLSVALLLV